MNDFDAVVDLLLNHKFVALTGAGVSTASGIPDYRGPLTKLKPRNPITYQRFIASEETRQRYWARASIGWRTFSKHVPNPTHAALAELEAFGPLTHIITQNVDGLHQSAGSRNVTELHGTLSRVLCLDCGETFERTAIQERIELENIGWQDVAFTYAPDGDASIPNERVLEFHPPTCGICDGRLKPDVVFFGENVPDRVRDEAFTALYDAEALLVIGTSLHVYSGLRFVKNAAKYRKPVVIVTIGETRGDDFAWFNLQGRCEEVLPALATQLVRNPRHP